MVMAAWPIRQPRLWRVYFYAHGLGDLIDVAATAMDDFPIGNLLMSPIIIVSLFFAVAGDVRGCRHRGWIHWAGVVCIVTVYVAVTLLVLLAFVFGPG